MTALPLPTQTWLRDCATAPRRAPLRSGRGARCPAVCSRRAGSTVGLLPFCLLFPQFSLSRNRAEPPPSSLMEDVGGAWHPQVCPLPTSRAAHDLRSPSSLPRLSPGEMEAQGQLAGLDPRAGPRSPGASTCRLWNHSLSPRPAGSGASQPVVLCGQPCQGPPAFLSAGHGAWCPPACQESLLWSLLPAAQLSWLPSWRFSLQMMLRVEDSPRRDQDLP